MIRQITYTEQELCDVFKCKINRIRDLRKLGVLKGTKTGKGYVYHDREIDELFEEYTPGSTGSSRPSLCQSSGSV